MPMITHTLSMQNVLFVMIILPPRRSFLVGIWPYATNVPKPLRNWTLRSGIVHFVEAICSVPFIFTQQNKEVKVKHWLQNYEECCIVSSQEHVESRSLCCCICQTRSGRAVNDGRDQIFFLSLSYWWLDARATNRSGKFDRSVLEIGVDWFTRVERWRNSLMAAKHLTQTTTSRANYPCVRKRMTLSGKRDAHCFF